MSAIFHSNAFGSARPVPLIAIGSEVAGDAPARELLLDAVMGPDRKLKSSELLRTGQLPADDLALVARDAGGALVGTVRLWHVTAGRKNGIAIPALLLGPLAVDRRFQSAGVGRALMSRAIGRAAKRGHGAIVLVGDPEYYGRFGFTAAHTSRLSMPGPFEARRLLGLELRDGSLAGAAGCIEAPWELRAVA